MRYKEKGILFDIVDLILPWRGYCNNCKLLSNELFCIKCSRLLREIKRRTCIFCSIPLKEEIETFCYDCKEGLNLEKKGINNYNKFLKNKSIYEYRGLIKTLISDFKYNQKTYLVRPFAQIIINTINKEKIDFDLIIPVPQSKERTIKRGFNPSELLSNYIGNNLGVEVLNDLVIRRIDTRPMKELVSIKSREDNLLKAFSVVRGYRLEGRKVLIIDDIYTTGTTLKFLHKEIIKYNIDSFQSITIAKVL